MTILILCLSSCLWQIKTLFVPQKSFNWKSNTFSFFHGTQCSSPIKEVRRPDFHNCQTWLEFHIFDKLIETQASAVAISRDLERVPIELKNELEWGALISDKWLSSSGGPFIDRRQLGLWVCCSVWCRWEKPNDGNSFYHDGIVIFREGT